MDNKVIEQLKEYINKDSKDSMNLNVNNFMDIIYQYDLYEYTDQIYDESYMTDVLKKELDKDNWVTVRNMLSGIHDIHENYYYRDGYGNFSNVTNNDINCIVDDIVKDYERNYKEEYDL